MNTDSLSHSSGVVPPARTSLLVLFNSSPEAARWLSEWSLALQAAVERTYCAPQEGLPVLFFRPSGRLSTCYALDLVAMLREASL